MTEELTIEEKADNILAKIVLVFEAVEKIQQENIKMKEDIEAIRLAIGI